MTDNLMTEFQMAFTSPNCLDANGETANTVDGLFAIAHAIRKLAASVEYSADIIANSNRTKEN